MGIIFGLVILGAVFGLRLGSAPQSPSLYDVASALAINLPQTQSGGESTALGLTYTILAAFGLQILAGLLGVLPLGAGILGIIVMLMITGAVAAATRGLGLAKDSVRASTCSGCSQSS